MLTIFTTPKPFRGHIDIIQRNAIKSWTLLRPKCEVILFGDDEGTADVAEKFGHHHCPDTAVNEFGTPMLDDIFERVRNLASNETLCYVNSDVILMDDFVEAIRRIKEKKDRFLIIGQHWRMDIDKPLSFEPGWAEELRRKTYSHGKEVTLWAMDFFAFSKNESFNMPPLAVGRPRWDNWLVYKARALKLPVIDISEVTMVIHQNHDYAHVPEGSGKSFEGPEADANRLSLKEHGEDGDFGFDDATHKMTSDGLCRALSRRYLSRYMYTVPKLYPMFSPFARLALALVTTTRPARLWLRKKLTRNEK